MGKKLWATVVALMLLLASCQTMKAVEKAPSLEQTTKGVAELRADLTTANQKIKAAGTSAAANVEKLPETPANTPLKIDLRRDVVTIQTEAAKQEQALSSLAQKEPELKEQAKAVEKLKDENAALKSEGTRWLNTVALPVGVFGLAISIGLAVYGFGIWARGIGAFCGVLIVLALVLPMLATIAHVIAWGVSAFLLLALGWLLWSYRRSIAETVHGVEKMKTELPTDTLQKWFKSETPAMTVFQSDTTMGVIKEIRNKLAKKKSK